jgi:hypothetical protein
MPANNRWDLIQRLNGLTQYSCANPLNSSSGVFSFMMFDEVIIKLVIKLFCCKRNYDSPTLMGKSVTRPK